MWHCFDGVALVCLLLSASPHFLVLHFNASPIYGLIIIGNLEFRYIALAEIRNETCLSMGMIVHERIRFGWLKLESRKDIDRFVYDWTVQRQSFLEV